jgi:hypothetical protein
LTADGAGTGSAEDVDDDTEEEDDAAEENTAAIAEAEDDIVDGRVLLVATGWALPSLLVGADCCLLEEVVAACWPADFPITLLLAPLPLLPLLALSATPLLVG